jgi:hypothetical protein
MKTMNKGLLFATLFLLGTCALSISKHQTSSSAVQALTLDGPEPICYPGPHGPVCPVAVR